MNLGLKPLVSCHGVSVTTVEGVGSERKCVHQVQKRIVPWLNFCGIAHSRDIWQNKNSFRMFQVIQLIFGQMFDDVWWFVGSFFFFFIILYTSACHSMSLKPMGFEAENHGMQCGFCTPGMARNWGQRNEIMRSGDFLTWIFLKANNWSGLPEEFPVQAKLLSLVFCSRNLSLRSDLEAKASPSNWRVPIIFLKPHPFTTVDQVMNTYALLRAGGKPTAEESMKNYDGNICRCTGYRNLVQATALWRFVIPDLLHQPFFSHDCHPN